MTLGSLPWRYACASLLALGLTACGGGGGGSAVPTAQLRAIHASADAPKVDILVNGSAALTAVAYKTVSAFLNPPSGVDRIQINPTGSTSSVIDTKVTLSPGHQYTAVALGSVSSSAPAGESLQLALVDDPGNAPATGNVKLRVVHGAPGVPGVDIYVSDPTAALPATPTVAALSFAGIAPAAGSQALQVPAGQYRIRITPAGQPASIAFDSGPLTLAAGSDLLLTAIPAVASAAPIELLAAVAGASSFEIPDVRAAVRVGHFSPNTPAVDVHLHAPSVALSASNLVAPDLMFPMNTSYLPVPADSYRASVALAASETEVIGLDAAPTAGQNLSVFAIGLLQGSGAQALRLAAYPDDRVPAPGMAKVRVIHLSPDAPAVDVVTLINGQPAARLVQNLSFPNATATSLLVPPGSYTLGVVPTGASAPVLPSSAGTTVSLSAGEVVTIAAVGCLATTGACAGGQPFQLVVLSDN